MKDYYVFVMNEAHKLFLAGYFAEAEKLFYRAWHLAVYSHFCGVSHRMAANATLWRQRCYRAMRATK